MNDTPDNRNSDESVDEVDWWASRVVDREVEFADVPANLRSRVQERATDFAAIRNGLSAFGVPGAVDEVGIARALRASSAPAKTPWARLGGPLGMAAALIAVIAIGITAIGRDSRSDDDLTAADRSTMSTPLAKTVDQTAPATEAPQIQAAGAAASEAMSSTGEVIEIADMVELGSLTNDWWTTPPVTDSVSMCPLAEGMQRVVMDVTFAGIPAEIHLGANNLKVVALSDCMVLAGITP